jgi:shikimate kinase
MIISLGGGTPCYANNHELLKQEGVISIYLKASIDTLFARLSYNKSKRPLIADKTNEEMKSLLQCMFLSAVLLQSGQTQGDCR